MSHTCKAIMFQCMDFRLTSQIRDWLDKEGLMGNCDIVSAAGAGKEIFDGSQHNRDFLLKQIELSIKLHNSKQVILLHHSQCGAYNSSYNFATPEEEKIKQASDLMEIEKIIKERFPQVEVIKVWAEMKDDQGKKIEFVKI